MHIKVNGELHPLSDGQTLASLLEQLGVSTAQSAAEVNGRIIPRSLHQHTPLSEADIIEIVSFIGGG